jgi:hypothetical protein
MLSACRRKHEGVSRCQHGERLQMLTWVAATICAAVTASLCHMLRTGKLLCRTLQGRRSAVARLEACSGGGSKGAPGQRLPGSWAALLAQLSTAAQTRVRLDALAADAAGISNRDPVLQVCQDHGPSVLELPSWQSGGGRHWQLATACCSSVQLKYLQLEPRALHALTACQSCIWQSASIGTRHLNLSVVSLEIRGAAGSRHHTMDNDISLLCRGSGPRCS